MSDVDGTGAGQSAGTTVAAGSHSRSRPKRAASAKLDQLAKKIVCAFMWIGLAYDQRMSDT